MCVGEVMILFFTIENVFIVGLIAVLIVLFLFAMQKLLSRIRNRTKRDLFEEEHERQMRRKA